MTRVGLRQREGGHEHRGKAEAEARNGHVTWIGT
jgi:hypothetical protein